jgi:hypothetical protein
VSRTKVERHVHINGYEVSDDLERKFLGIGFFFDPFKKLERGSTHPMLEGARFMPQFHYSFETDNFGEMQSAFNASVEAIQSEADFVGYVESETVPEAYNARLNPAKPYNPQDDKIEIPQFELIQVPEGKHKACDIHMKRPAESPRDALDDILLNAGCYEVHTPRSRIYTLQFESGRDGIATFNLFNEFFRENGGMKHIYLEVAKDMYKQPADFEFVPYIRKGSLSSAPTPFF